MILENQRQIGYFIKNNKLIACIYRYDTDDGKEFRVWDVKQKKLNLRSKTALQYSWNHTSKKIILIEGEKSVDVLIYLRTTATTAMFGANAPINKTDWSPLIGKEVIIWPDNDEMELTTGQKSLNIWLSCVFCFSRSNPAKHKSQSGMPWCQRKFNINSLLKGSFKVLNKNS